jgi:hypothetical protein
MSAEIKIELGKLLERTEACWEKKRKEIPAKRTSIDHSYVVPGRPETPLREVGLNTARDFENGGCSIEKTFYLCATALPDERCIRFHAAYNAAPEIIEKISVEDFSDEICEKMIDQFIVWLADK